MKVFLENGGKNLQHGIVLSNCTAKITLEITFTTDLKIDLDNLPPHDTLVQAVVNLKSVEFLQVEYNKGVFMSHHDYNLLTQLIESLKAETKMVPIVDVMRSFYTLKIKF